MKYLLLSVLAAASFNAAAVSVTFHATVFQTQSHAYSSDAVLPDLSAFPSVGQTISATFQLLDLGIVQYRPWPSHLALVGSQGCFSPDPCQNEPLPFIATSAFDFKSLLASVAPTYGQENTIWSHENGDYEFHSRASYLTPSAGLNQESVLFQAVMQVFGPVGSYGDSLLYELPDLSTAVVENDWLLRMSWTHAICGDTCGGGEANILAMVNSITLIPEPSALGLIAIGLVAMLPYRRRRVRSV